MPEFVRDGKSPTSQTCVTVHDNQGTVTGPWMQSKNHTVAFPWDARFLEIDEPRCDFSDLERRADS